MFVTEFAGDAPDATSGVFHDRRNTIGYTRSNFHSSSGLRPGRPGSPSSAARGWAVTTGGPGDRAGGPETSVPSPGGYEQEAQQETNRKTHERRPCAARLPPSRTSNYFLALQMGIRPPGGSPPWLAQGRWQAGAACERWEPVSHGNIRGAGRVPPKNILRLQLSHDTDLVSFVSPSSPMTEGSPCLKRCFSRKASRAGGERNASSGRSWGRRASDTSHRGNTRWGRVTRSGPGDAGAPPLEAPRSPTSRDRRPRGGREEAAGLLSGGSARSRPSFW